MPCSAAGASALNSIALFSIKLYAAVTIPEQQMRFAIAIIAFLLAFATAVAFELLVVGILRATLDSGIDPHGFGWWFLPIGAGLSAARFAPRLSRNHLAFAFGSLGNVALAGASLLAWWLAFLAFLWNLQAPFGMAALRDAFDPRMDLARTLQWLIGPPVAAVLIALFLRAWKTPPYR